MAKTSIRAVLATLICTWIALAIPSTRQAQAWTYEQDFIDDAGQPDPGGWVAKNLNAADIPGPYFAPQAYGGRSVLWCGKTDPTYAGGSGYGNNWNMWVEKEFTQASVYGNPGRIAFDIQYDTEGGYDWVCVMVSYDGRASWDTMDCYSGASSGFVHYELNWNAFTPPPIWIRFAFQSDGGWSDQDQIINTDGAFRLDNVQLIDISNLSVRDESTFETGMDGWIAGKPTPPGPEYRLQPVDYWSDYAPRPDAVPYAWTAIEQPNGLFPPQDYGAPAWFVGIESPRLEIPADADEYSFTTDIYFKLPVSQYLFYFWQVAAPAPEDGGTWRSRNFYYYGSGGWTTRKEDVTNLVASGATSMRIRLAARYASFWGGNGYFSGPGPIFGAVRVDAPTAVQNGALAGRVYQAPDSDCPSPGAGLYGVTVNLFNDTGGAVASLVTDAEGNFAAVELPEGPYQLSLVRPLGYIAPSDDLPIAIVGGETTQADYALSCVAASGDVRTIGFWKHQVNQAQGGGGLGGGRAISMDDPAPPDDIDSPVCDLLDLIVEHFNDNAVNQVQVYVPDEDATCRDKLELALSLLNLQGSQAMIARARQQLMALLLNAADGRIALTAAVSEDGATLSQAITYCDNLIDDLEGDHELAKTIADEINNGRLVAAGLIPLETVIIAYSQAPVAEGTRLSISPNPFNPTTKISFSLTAASDYQLAIYDISGKLVRSFEASGRAGQNILIWDGRDRNGNAMGSGIYLCSLAAEGRRETQKMALVK